ncbi:helix-turn-helix domain-containing protein [Helicobacter saguini]|uniref:AraC family transcriptional regulator n=1 Tax=Helicobacter saguini TaxID=1548018 RepID=A0A347VS88_9HELI|nr:AraC family transcriptional regulator [Helicobacter saguini]MWV62608.1 helix-turn-helix domain-containing protein [Helicobacter saguini]MWV66720.1 helix-turn-helix domain-containing protein [Helicobacter saguini]MWV69070.1 helix-turn-helix domain-containing protein [Helicobacter saguini]MWV71376.1 helix-turn-helix domain-containing protein [Helicobacter saguini]TLD94009.1 AraC family transcriptional regulator [Helicobacter saguini]
MAYLNFIKANKSWEVSEFTNDKNPEFTDLKVCSKNFNIDSKGIYLFDGVYLNIGNFNGNFKDFSNTSNDMHLHFGICLNGEYKGFFDKNKEFNLAKNSIWCCNSAQKYTATNINCQAIEFHIDINYAIKPLQSLLKSLKLARLHDRFNTPKVILNVPKLKRIFSQVNIRANSDFLRIQTLNLLLFLQEYIESPLDYLQNVVAFLERNCQDDITLNALSEEFGVSVSKLNGDFKARYGSSIYQFIKYLRIKKATSLLKTTHKSISQIANEVGYINISAFCKNFKDFHSCTPKQYQRYCNI